MSDEPRDVGGDEGQDGLPQIDLRIPGPWRTPAELYDGMERSAPEYDLSEWGMVHRPTGRRFDVGVSPHDDEIHEVFAGAGRITGGDVERIASHAVKVHVSGPGGLPDAARAVMEAATALVRAGGYGVMVDNSGNCHGVEDWLALAGDTQPGGLYWAYVSVTGGRDAVFSAGMHCLGFRDAEIQDPESLGAPDVNAVGFFLHNFLGYVYQVGQPDHQRRRAR